MYNPGDDFIELPPDLKFPKIKTEDICPLLGDIVVFFEKWSPESYEGYFLGCSLALASIISARRAQYYMGGLRATNLNIVLVGDTGLSAKTTVMNLVKVVLKDLGLEFFLFPDTITAQRFFSEMCIDTPEDYDKKDDLEKKELLEKTQKNKAFVGQRGWIFDEMGNLFREMMQTSHYNSGYRELLKRLDDNQPELSNSTHVRGDEKSYYPFLTVLGAMTPADLSPHAQKGTTLWHDGLLARIVFICSPVDFRNDLPFPDGERIIPQHIIRELRAYHERLGTPQIQLTPKVKVIPAQGEIIDIPKEVKKAYYRYRNALKDIIQNSEEKDLAGNYIRYPDIALRIAVLIASLNNDSQLTLDHWSFVQNITENWRRDLHRLYYQTLCNDKSKSRSPSMDPLERVFSVIKTKGSPRSRVIQQQTGYKAHSVDSLLCKLLEQNKIIKITDGDTYVFEVNFDNPDV